MSIRKQIQPGEHVHAVYRKHWFPFVTTLIPIIIFAFLPSWIYSYLSNTPQLADAFASLTSAVSGDTLGFLYSLLLFFLFIVTFTLYTDFYLDAWILTDKRILDIEQGGFFNRSTSSFLLDHIQDVTVEIRGLFPTIFGYGTLHIQTAGGLHEFTIPYIARPNRMKTMIIEAQMISKGKTI